MEVILSVAMSLDGYIDDCLPDRLKLSGAEDWNAVQQLRATCDAILVGAGTIRKDNPSLVIRDEEVRSRRAGEGMDADLVKVTVTSMGVLDRDSAFFKEGAGRKIVFTTNAGAGRLADLPAEIISAEQITAGFIVKTLSGMGYGRLMVEGGSDIITMFLRENAVDYMRLAVAPFFVGDENAPRFVKGGKFPWDKDNRMELQGVEMSGYMAVMNYKLKK